MATYIENTVIKHALIKQSYMDDAGVFDQSAFETAIEQYLLDADSIYLSIIKKKGLTVADVPTFAEGMTRNAVDMLKHYVYYSWFDDNSVSVRDGDKVSNPNKSNAIHFEQHYNDALTSLTDFDILNDNTLESDSFSGIYTADRETF